jgi:hypothetical protein
MLHEFAVDPEVMTSWQTVRYLSDHFGVERGRLISRFPSSWKRMVYDACGRRPGLGDIEKAKIIEKIRLLDEKLVSTGRTYDPAMLWLDNAESAHSQRPFRAIIATINPRRHPFVLVVDDLDETVALWNVPREGKVARSAQAMSDCVPLLFQMSRSILFIDPHFTPEPRFVRPLIKFLQVASDVVQRTGRPFDRIEYHLSCKYDASIFINNCQGLIHQVPASCAITFFRWKTRKPGEDLHPRYILSDVGGIRFERGLDDGEPGETTDVGALARALYDERWKDFQPASGATAHSTYDLVDRIRVIGGKQVILLP